MKKAILLSTVALTISACAVTSNQGGVMQAQERSGGLFGMSKNEDVQVTSAEAFKGKKDIVIGGFKVGFNESKRLKNEAKGFFGGSGMGGKSTGLVKLENIDNTDRQKITDTIYKDFIADLEAKGYTVHDRNKFVNSKEFEGTKLYDFPYESDDSGMLSSYGVARYFSPSEIGNKQPIFIGEIQGVTGGFAFANPMNATTQYAQKTGTAVVNVSYIVDFAGAGGHAGITSSSLEVGQVLSVDQGFLGLTGGEMSTFSADVGSMTLGQPIASDKEFAKITNTTSDAEAGLETATNVFTAVLGGGTNQTREFVYEADKAKYSDAAIDALKKANDKFIDKMVSLK